MTITSWKKTWRVRWPCLYGKIKLRSKVIGAYCHENYSWRPGWQDWLYTYTQSCWWVIRLGGRLGRSFFITNECGMYHPWAMTGKALAHREDTFSMLRNYSPAHYDWWHRLYYKKKYEKRTNNTIKHCFYCCTPLRTSEREDMGSVKEKQVITIWIKQIKLQILTLKNGKWLKMLMQKRKWPYKISV